MRLFPEIDGVISGTDRVNMLIGPPFDLFVGTILHTWPGGVVVVRYGYGAASAARAGIGSLVAARAGIGSVAVARRET